jgi:hypothetical protein
MLPPGGANGGQWSLAWGDTSRGKPGGDSEEIGDGEDNERSSNSANGSDNRTTLRDIVRLLATAHMEL